MHLNLFSTAIDVCEVGQINYLAYSYSTHLKTGYIKIIGRSVCVCVCLSVCVCVCVCEHSHAAVAGPNDLKFYTIIAEVDISLSLDFQRDPQP